MTELQTLKRKKKTGKASPEDLTRLKVLQDGEPLSTADLEEAKKREEKRAEANKKAYDAKHSRPAPPAEVDKTLDIPAEHPRIAKIKEALLPFTQIEAHITRADDFVLFTRGVKITAGDVRKAREAMKL